MSENSRQQNVEQALRSFFLLYNICRTYTPEHTVFLRSVQENMPIIMAALNAVPKITLSFHHEQVFLDGVPLQTGSEQFKRIARIFENLGIPGLILRSGLKSDEMILFMRVISNQADDVRRDGLRKVLAKSGIKHVDENAAVFGSAGRGGGAGGGGLHAGTFDLEGGEDSGFGTDFECETSGGPLTESENKSFRGFIQKTLMDKAGGSSVDDMASRISDEFDRRLESGIEEFRRAQVRTERRLDNVKSIFMKKMEDMGVPALIVDTDLNILVLSSAADNILNHSGTLSGYPQLARFIATGQTSTIVEMDGIQRKIFAVRSGPMVGGDHVVLLTIE